MRIKNDYVSSSVSYQMLLRLIHKHDISVDELATKLGISVKDLEDILTKKAIRKKFAYKLTGPLANLYCHYEV